MIRSVIRFHHWLPNDVENLYLDAVDHHGLVYWYDDVIQYGKEIKERQKQAEEAAKRKKPGR